jgi:biopolymer transport protein ExbB
VRTLILLIFLGLLPASGQRSFESAVASAEKDLDQSLKRLATQQAAIAKDKVPLAAELRGVETEVRKHRREAEMARRTRDSHVYDLNALERRVALWRDEHTYMRQLLGGYAEQWEAGMALPELSHYENVLKSTRSSEPASPVEAIEAQLGMVKASIERLENLLGGQRFPGKVLVEKGAIIEGEHVLFGPIALFGSEEVAGLTISDRSLQPKLRPWSGKEAQAVRVLLKGDEGAIPIDVTQGTATALAESRDSLWAHIRKGGFWIVPILLLALIAMVMAVIRWRELVQIKQPPPGLVHQILIALQDGEKEKARSLAASAEHPVSGLLVAAVEHAHESRELLEEIIYESWLETQPPLQRYLSFISVTAATAPLLGLLGTVTGMITTFGLINVFGTGDAKNLSGGISEALITTEFGLVVAIPALLMHAYLNRKVQGIITTMEQFGMAFLNGLPKAQGQ